MIDHIDPLDDAPDPAAHWRELSSMRAGTSRRLPEADITAMALAVAQFPCLRLRDAILRLADTTPPSTEELQTAEQLKVQDRNPEVERSVMEATQPGDVREKSYGARLARRFVDGSKAAGPVRPGSERPAEEVELEHVGRAQGVMDDLAKKLTGVATSDCIDIDDLATVTQFPTDSVSTALREFDAVLGNDWLVGGARAVETADLHVLAEAVRSADAVMPLYERVAVRVGAGRFRWQVVAVCVPAMLALAGLVPASMSGDRSPLLELTGRITEVASLLAAQADPPT